MMGGQVRWSWVPNTFPRMYLNSGPISLVVRSMVLPQENAIYMVPRPWQKLGGDSNFCCVHNGNFAGDCEFNSYVSYFLTLIKTISILVFTHITLFLLSLNLSWWWVGKRKAPFRPKFSIVHPTNSQLMPSSIMGFKYVKGLLPIHYGVHLGPWLES